MISQLGKRDWFLYGSTGSGGLSVARQIYNRFEAAGKPLADGDIGIVDGAEDHYYQVSQKQFYRGQCQLVDFR